MTLQDCAASALARADDGPALCYEGRWHSWRELHLCGAEVQRLIAASGAVAEATALFIARNRPAAYPALLALLAQGRTVRMLYSFLSAEAKAAEIARLSPGIVVVTVEDTTPDVLDAIGEAGAVGIVLDQMTARTSPGLERSTASPDPQASAEPTIEIQTSGTSGPPKRFAVSYAQIHRRFVAPTPVFAQGVDPDSLPPALVYMSLANISGVMSAIPALMQGQRIELHDRFDIAAWRRYVATYRPAHMGLQPAGVQMLLDSEGPHDDLASLESLTVGSAPLEPAQQMAFEARFGIQLLLAYGATEFLGTATRMTPELRAQCGERKLGSVGRAVPGVALRIVDPVSGALLGAGEEGLIAFHCAEVRPDWIGTTDLGMIDADGFLFLRGRADGAIIRGGFKLLPEAIERTLLLHDAVAAAAVVGVPDRRLGQVPGAAVQLRPGAAATEEGLTAHLRAALPATHIPVHWRLLPDLPRTASLKVDRGAVARLFRAASP